MMTSAHAAVAVLMISVGVTAGQPASLASPVDLQSAALTRMRDAVNRGDATAYASVYAPFAVISIFGGNELRGREAIERHERDLLIQFPGTRFEFYAIWRGEPPIVVAHYGVNGQTAAGGGRRAMGHEGLLFFEFNSAGEIVREDRYLDSFTPMAQLGALKGVTARALPVLPDRPRRYVSDGPVHAAGRVAVVQRAFAAFDARQASMLDYVAEDAIIDELMLPEPFPGPRAWPRWLKEMASLAKTRFEVRQIVGVGSPVLIAGVWHGEVVAGFRTITPSPTPFQVHRAAIVELDARDKIVLFRAFMNGRELAQSVGQ